GILKPCYQCFNTWGKSKHLPSRGFSNQHGLTPAQIGSESPAVEQLLDMRNTFVTWSFELLQLHARNQKSIVQFLGALARGPLRLELLGHPIDLTEVNAITASVRAAILSVVDAASGNGLSYNLSQVADLIILLGLSNVKGFAVYYFPRSIQCCDKCATDI